jgi:hypothetical protein
MRINLLIQGKGWVQRCSRMSFFCATWQLSIEEGGQINFVTGTQRHKKPENFVI